VGEIGPEIIPGVIGLTRWENDGAMLNILSGQQWLLAGIAFGAAIVLVMILLRYNEGFWGTLGLAAVLGGTVGNLVDRIFNDGKVIDMFRTLFINFPIFNIADIFITLGFITFLIHFIAISFGVTNEEHLASDYASDDYQDDYDDSDYDEFEDIDAAVSVQTEQDYAPPQEQYAPEQRYSQKPQQRSRPPASRKPQQKSDPRYSSEPRYAQEPQYSSEPQYAPESQYPSESDMSYTDDYEPITDTTPDTSYSMDDLEAELGSLDDYNLDDILREYGIEDDDNQF